MILIVGGAGYIGSHTNKILSRNYKTLVYENLIYGHRDAVKWGEFVLGDLNDIDLLRLVFDKYQIDAVLHFAAFACVGESVSQPEKYYNNNVGGSDIMMLILNATLCF